jgi:hypothetical protein
MKKIICLLSFVLFVSSLPVAAQNTREQQQAAQARAARQKKLMEDQAEKMRKNNINKAIDDFLDTHDKNKDKSVTFEEYVAGETNAADAEKKFKQYNKNNDRYLSKSEIQEMLGLNAMFGKGR